MKRRDNICTEYVMDIKDKNELNTVTKAYLFVYERNRERDENVLLEVQKRVMFASLV